MYASGGGSTQSNKNISIRLGFWASLLTASVSAVFMVVAIATPARSGPFCGTACVAYPYTDVAAFIPQDYIWLYPGFLLAPIFVVLVSCIHGYAADAKKVFSRIGLSFALLYAGIIMTDYFISSRSSYQASKPERAQGSPCSPSTTPMGSSSRSKRSDTF